MPIPINPNLRIDLTGLEREYLMYRSARGGLGLPYLNYDEWLIERNRQFGTVKPGMEAPGVSKPAVDAPNGTAKPMTTPGTIRLNG